MLVSWISPLSPANRIGHAIASTPELSWAFSFLRAFPRANVALIGGSARDAVLGRIPPRYQLIVYGIAPQRLEYWRTHHVASPLLEITHASQGIAAFLAERIFTVNALAYDIKEGTLLDPFSAIHQLQQGHLTTLRNPDIHFRQAPHDAVRALRLAAQLGISPSPTVWRAALAHAPRVNYITSDDQGFTTYKTPRELLMRESLLTLKRGMYGWELLSRSGVSMLAFPHLANEGAHKIATAHFASVHDRDIRSRYAPTALSDHLLLGSLFIHHSDRVRLYSINAQSMRHDNIRHPHLALSPKQLTQILTKTHALLNENPSLWSLSRIEHVLKGHEGSEALSLAHITTLHDPQLRSQAPHIARAALLRERLVRDVHPPQLLRGRDLLPLGIAEGPHIRFYLNRVRDEQLKGDLATKEAALAYLQNIILQ